MASIKEIKNRIDSVKETQKITNAMYLIASTKMRKAKACLDQTRPYFNALQAEIKRIFRSVDEIDSVYFYPTVDDVQRVDGTYAYLVITADKGLAGSYNQNVIKQAQKLISQHDDYKLFVVGEYGREFFTAHKIPIEKSFLYTTQNPTFHRARKICATLLDLYLRKEITKIYVIYTDFCNGMESAVRCSRLLPFHKAHFAAGENEEKVTNAFDFEPSVEKVLENMIPSYISGYIFSALIDSFCCEQNARMTAMDSANRNAQKLIDEMTLEHHHIRQKAITQEITEVSSGAKYQRIKKLAKEGAGK